MAGMGQNKSLYYHTGCLFLTLAAQVLNVKCTSQHQTYLARGWFSYPSSSKGYSPFVSAVFIIYSLFFCSFKSSYSVGIDNFLFWPRQQPKLFNFISSLRSVPKIKANSRCFLRLSWNILIWNLLYHLAVYYFVRRCCQFSFKYS